MATPTPVDQMVQRDPPPPPPPDQADTPGSPPNKDLAEEANDNEFVNDDFAPSSGPDTPDVTAEVSAISLSLPDLSIPSSSSSPHISSTEDSPQEASSSSSDYDSDSSEEDPATSKGAEAHFKSVAEDDDKDQRVPHATATTTVWQPLARPFDTCLGAGWSPGDALPNRSFANGTITVARSALQGHGVFAAADIRAGTDVLMEAPLLRARGLEKLRARHARLGEEERAVYDGLVGHHEWETCPVRQKWCANSFELARGYNGVFAIASNFNHACRGQRNTMYEWDEFDQAMTFTATRDIEKGAEMLVSYCEYRHVLKDVYGFVCHCGGCEHQEIDLFANMRS